MPRTRRRLFHLVTFLVSLAVAWSGMPAAVLAPPSSATEASASAAPDNAGSVDVEGQTVDQPALARAERSPVGQEEAGRAEAGPPGRVRELVAQRKADTKVFELSDGRLQAEVTTDPIHYRDGNGRWQDVDTRVGGTSREGFAHGNSKNSFASFFGTASDRLARFEVGNRHLTMGIAGDRRNLTPQVEGSTVTYQDVFGTADLVYRVEPTGLKEEIVLAEPPAEASFTFVVQMGGVIAREQEDGSIGFFRPGGEGPAVFEIPKPFMFDSTDTADTPIGTVRSDDVTQSVEQQGSRIEVTVTADAAWLASDERNYPVIIDPTIVIEPTPTQGQDTMIREAAPDTNYGFSWQLGVGTDSTGAARSLLKFDLSWLPAGTELDAAQLRVWYDQAYHTNANDVLIEAYDAAVPWDESTVTWSNLPGAIRIKTSSRESVDNGDEGKTSQFGFWPFMTDTAQSQFGINNDFQYNRAETTHDTYTWVPELTESGDYEVQAHYVATTGRTTHAPYTVHHAGGSTTVEVDQTVGSGGQWATLGTWPFNAGTSHRVVLGTVPELRTVVADAVRLAKWGQATKTAFTNSQWHCRISPGGRPSGINRWRSLDAPVPPVCLPVVPTGV